jgi:hypothetical protein
MLFKLADGRTLEDAPVMPLNSPDVFERGINDTDVESFDFSNTVHGCAEVMTDNNQLADFGFELAHESSPFV